MVLLSWVVRSCAEVQVLTQQAASEVHFEFSWQWTEQVCLEDRISEKLDLALTRPVGLGVHFEFVSQKQGFLDQLWVKQVQVWTLQAEPRVHCGQVLQPKGQVLQPKGQVLQSKGQVLQPKA
jgi:hypothetical protein